MWLYKTSFLLLCLLLTACGFRPLYVSSCDSEGASYPLKIGTIEDRNGQVLRNYLLDRLASKGSSKQPLYRLDVTLTESVVDIGVQKDETSKRKQITMSVVLKLKNLKNDDLFQHTTSTINSYEVLTTNYYADDVATQYAEKEALRMLADKIRMFVSAYLDSQECPCYAH